jgi:predicted transcriptional regulator
MMSAETQVIASVRAGSTIEEAARQAGKPVATVRRWLTAGRKAPDGRYGELARAVDQAREGRRVEVSDGPMSLEEIERLLVRAIRSGSLQAVKLWLALHPNDGATPADDPFSEFDPVDAR